MIRCLICVLLMGSASLARADATLLLLLRMMRDQAISTSLEAGAGAMRKDAPPLPARVYALPTPAIPQGQEEQHVRALIDESFPHLSGAQRDAVFAGMQEVLKDPRHSQMRARIVGEFALQARAVGESYRMLDRLSSEQKRALARQARAEFSLLPEDERKQLLDMLQAGLLPVPRDLNAIMLAELETVEPRFRGRQR